MVDYIAPIADMKFVLRHIAEYEKIIDLPGNDEAGWDLVDAVLEEAAKMANSVISPLNWIGDQQGAQHTGDGVAMPEGWNAAYHEVANGGWIGLACDPTYGGQGLPVTVGSVVSEIWEGASITFALCNLLTQGAIDALELNGTDAQKARYMAPLIEGRWTGTMNLTEPQAGSDLAEIRTKAIPEGDYYRIHGQKIFISFGDHDLTENIIHLVLARLPDAPAGVKGISLFVVPKIIVNDDGSLGETNDLRCVSIEHKLGIHASPTAIMSFGDNEGAKGYLVGEANHGLEYMFVMMNRARFEMGIQGLGIAEMAYQSARAYALDRVQGKPLGHSEKGPIIGHPDVRRMMMDMKSRIEAMRGLAYFTAAQMDIAQKAEDQMVREMAQKRVEYLIPIVKGWCTETGQEISSVALQVHGGIGYVEETGIAQYYRDSRIMTIYEGTTGIQANDLIFRKTLRDDGAVAVQFVTDIRALDAALSEAGFETLRIALKKAADQLEATTEWLVGQKQDPASCAAGGYNYLRMAGIVLGGLQMAKMAVIAKQEMSKGEYSKDFLNAKIHMADFYAHNVMPELHAYAEKVLSGTPSIFALVDEQF